MAGDITVQEVVGIARIVELNITLNNLIVRIQECWSFGKCGLLLYCHYSQVHSDPEW